jgi:hypothetical protein
MKLSSLSVVRKLFGRYAWLLLQEMNLIRNSQEHRFSTFEGPSSFANKEGDQKLARSRVDLPLDGGFVKGYSTISKGVFGVEGQSTAIQSLI